MVMAMPVMAAGPCQCAWAVSSGCALTDLVVRPMLHVHPVDPAEHQPDSPWPTPRHPARRPRAGQPVFLSRSDGRREQGSGLATRLQLLDEGVPTVALPAECRGGARGRKGGG